MRIFSLIVLALGLWSCSAPVENPISNTNELGLIPMPQTIQLEKGGFIFDKNTGFISETEMHPNLKIFIDQMGLSNPINEHSKTNIEFSLIETDSIHKAAYFLDIRPKGISIKAKSAEGFFYALQTFRQLLPDTLSSEESYILPALSIYDYPKFEWRGAHLDVCRHFFDKAFIKKYIDLLAKHKMNTFHWHLTEDQGWRIEIKKYPLLTSISSKEKRLLSIKTSILLWVITHLMEASTLKKILKRLWLTLLNVS